MQKFLAAIMVTIVFLIGCSSDTSTEVEQPGRIPINNNAASLAERISHPGNLIYLNHLVDKDGNPTPSFVLVGEVEAPETSEGIAVRATSVAIHGTKAYVSYNREGEVYAGAIEVIDISNPSAPTVISQAIFDNDDLVAVAINPNGSQLLAAGSASIYTSEYEYPAMLEFMSLSDGSLTANPTRYDLPSWVGNSLYWTDQWLAVTSGNADGSGQAGGLGLLSLEEETFLETSVWHGFNNAQYVIGQDTRLVVLKGGTSGELRFYDAANKSLDLTTVVDVGPILPADGKNTMAIRDGLVYAALGQAGMVAYDLANPTEAVYTIARPDADPGANPEDYITNGVAVDNEYVYLANGAGGLYVAARPTNKSDELEVLGTWDFHSSANFVTSNDELVFVASGSGGLKILQKPDDYNPGQALLSYPFSTSYETGEFSGTWTVSGDWSKSTAHDDIAGRTGTFHLDGNPELTSQANGNGTAAMARYIRVPTDANAPMLSFWYRWDLNSYDHIYVEIQESGVDGWTRLADYSGANFNRAGQFGYSELSLNAYLGKVIGIRFRQQFSNDTKARMCTIDDLRIGDHDFYPTLNWPYDCNFETEALRNNWSFESDWVFSDEDHGNWRARDGQWFMDNDPRGTASQRNHNGSSRLNGWIPIPADADAPALTFWYDMDLRAYDHIYVELQVKGDASWTRLADYYGETWNRPAKFGKAEINLGTYTGNEVRVRFRSNYSSGGLFAIDQVRLGEIDLPALPYPYTNGFETETETAQWANEAQWMVSSAGHSTYTPHTGSGFLDNNPNEKGSLRNSNGSARLQGWVTIPADANQPVLSWWYDMSLQQYDHIYIDLQVQGSTEWIRKADYDGATWSRPGIKGRAEINLEAYAGQAIRFRVRSSYSTGGVYTMDDFRIGNLELESWSWPYSNGFETAEEIADWTMEGQWLATDGAHTSWTPHSGTGFLDNNPTEAGSLRNKNGSVRGTGWIPVPSDADYPVLSFYYRMETNIYDHLYVQIQTQDNPTWTRIGDYDGSTWSRPSGEFGYGEFNLTQFKGRNIRVRFAPSYSTGGVIALDDLYVGEYEANALSWPYNASFEDANGRAQWLLEGDWTINDTEHNQWQPSEGSWYLDNNHQEDGQRNHNGSARLNGWISVPSNATMPTLSFWYKMDLQQYDHVYFQVMRQGSAAWERVADYDGSTWSRPVGEFGYGEIKLDAFVGDNIRVRIAPSYSSGGLAALDQITIGELDLPTLSFPYSTGFESGDNLDHWRMEGDWIMGDTTHGAYAARTGSGFLDSNPDEAGQRNHNGSIRLGGWIDIPNDGTDRFLSFWNDVNLENYDHVYVQVQELGSSTWTRIADITNSSNSSDAFTERSLSLNAFKGESIRIRFAPSYSAGGKFVVDDLTIE